MGALSKAIKYAAAGKALKHAKHIKAPAKKTIFIILAVIGGIILLGLIAIIALIIWVVGLFTSDPVTQTANTVTQTAQSAIQGININDYVQDGQVNVAGLEQQIKSLTPEQLLLAANPLRDQINEWLDQGQIIQTEADRLLQLLP